MRERNKDQAEDQIVVTALTAIVREADATYERVGGSSRHWVRDCFLPTLNRHGWFVEAYAESDDDEAHIGAVGHRADE